MDMLLPLGLAALTAAAAFSCCLAYATTAMQALDSRERRFARDLNELYMMDVSARVAALLSMLSVVMGAFILGFLTASFIGTSVGGILGYLLPGFYVKQLKERRRQQLEYQLTDVMLTVANGVRASLNLVQSLQLVEQNAPVPASQEFGLLLREYEHGLAIEDAMEKAGERIASPNYRLLFSALQMHRSKGGDLPTLLDRLADSLREIQRLEAKAMTSTAQGRKSAQMMGFMPLVVMGMLYLFIDPEGVALLFTDRRGWIVLTIIMMLWAGGFAWIRKIVKIDI